MPAALSRSSRIAAPRQAQALADFWPSEGSRIQPVPPQRGHSVDVADIESILVLRKAGLEDDAALPRALEVLLERPQALLPALAGEAPVRFVGRARLRHVLLDRDEAAA